MPTITRRQVNDRNRSDHLGDMSDFQDHDMDLPDIDGQNQELEEEIEGEEQQDEAETVFPPPGLKEISSLASWTVSTAKPGNGVAALRSPDMTQFWQSDGPQPHLLSIHFFKLVPIVLMRIFLDSENDESYTPTKIQFLAGMGAHDLQEFAEMEFGQPVGWIDVDFSQVGPEPEEEDGTDHAESVDWSTRPVLRAMLVQVKILENHQNGKDTHLRGVQIFARDDTQQDRKHNKAATKLAEAFVSHEKPNRPQKMHYNNIKLASWMQEPDLR